MRALRTVLVVLLLVAAVWASDAPQPAQAVVVLISFDGFRPDYLERFETPNLKRLIQTGVRAEYLIPVFPTKTHPNHYTIVTGLYPDRHGIILNEMWDPVWQRRFDRRAVGTKEYNEWWDGEPIWVTARKQDRVASTMFWPGSDADINGWRPSDWIPFESVTPNQAKVDQVLTWLNRPPAVRPSFVTLYFSDTDDDGHEFGPSSNQMARAVQRVDAAVGRLLGGLEAGKLLDQIDLIALSDHGMAETPPDRVIFLDDYVALEEVDVSDWTPVLSVWPKPGRAEAVYGKLRGAHPRLSVYRPGELPARWHLGRHRRVSPIVGVADEGWTITTREQFERVRGRWHFGNHGFDNATASMRAIFIARGPHFKRGVVVPPIENIHLYELMCHLLGLRPAPNDGRLAAVAHLLNER